MKKVMLLGLILCFCMYTPGVAAETYHNKDYNFQIELPAEWGITKAEQSGGYIFNRSILYQAGEHQYIAGIGLRILRAKNIPGSDSLKHMTERGEKDFFGGLIKGLQEQHPAFEPTYTELLRIGDNVVGLIKGSENKYLKVTFAVIEKNGNNYMFTFATNDPNRAKESIFINMLKTLQPIISDTPSEITDEEIKYKRDIAERDVLDKYTNQEIKIVG